MAGSNLNKTDKFCNSLAQYVDSTSYVSDLTKDQLNRWTTALETLTAKSSKQSKDKWLSKLDLETLNEILQYISNKE